MKISLLLIALGFSLLLAGCASGTKNESQDAAMDDDTTASDQRPRPRPAIAPGSAHVSATVLGFETRDHHYLSTLRIEQVDEYGAGTPALPAGTEIDVVIPKALFDEDPDGTKAAALLATGHTVALTLTYQKAAQAGEAPPPPSWRARALQ